MSPVFCPNATCKLLLDDTDRRAGRCPQCGQQFAAAKARKTAYLGCLCGAVGSLIGLATAVYAFLHRQEYLYIDSTGLAAGPIAFAVVCGPLFLLAAALCLLGIVSWRRR